MNYVKPKKHLGQHFLTDESIAEKIAETLVHDKEYQGILEIGPGMGVMTKYLVKKYPSHTFKAVELDNESVEYLNKTYPDLVVFNEDFLRMDLSNTFSTPFAITGNFPYNISSQIVFKALDFKHLIPELTGMFQKEVAERICSGPGSKVYGIISVLVQAFYKAEYLFTVDETVFNPPPKVKSGVLRLTRLETPIDCDPKLFSQIVKQAFNQRRKTLRNSLRSVYTPEQLEAEIFNDRPERLSVEQFVGLVKMMSIENKN